MKDTKYIIMLLVGCMFIALMIWNAYNRVQLIHSYPKTVATVTDVTRFGNNATDTRVKFSTLDAKVIETELNGSGMNLAVGSKITVMYDPENPTIIISMTYWNVFGGAMLLLWLSIIFLVIGSGYFISKRFFARLNNEFSL